MAYVAWRGLVIEKHLSTELLAALEDRFTFNQMTHSHILSYFIPGPADRIAKGERSMNWVWYWNVAPGEVQKALLTDIKGRYGQGFVPEGLVKPEFVAKQKEMVAELLPEVFSKMVIDTEQPFIQPILDLSVDRMYVGSVCLIGEHYHELHREGSAGTKALGRSKIMLL